MHLPGDAGEGGFQHPGGAIDVGDLNRQRREQPYDLGSGYGHIALTVDDIDAKLAELAGQGIEPEKPAYHPGGRDDVGPIAFVADPDGYRVELIDGGSFRTPQD